MVPPFLIVTEWLAVAHSLPRSLSTLLLIFFLVLSVLGLLGHRVFLCLLVGLAGGASGWLLGSLMHVTPWFAAVPLSAAAGFAAWPRRAGQILLSLVIGFVLACTSGTVFTYGFNLLNFWTAAGVGFAGGAVLSLAWRRYLTALLFAAVGAFGGIAVLGGVVGAPTGFFARGGYAAYPKAWPVVGVVLLVSSFFLQLRLARGREI